MGKVNCWEFMRCGREPRGYKAFELGVCPAATESLRHGYNGGDQAGRYCWKVAGTLCGDAVQGSAIDKMQGCVACDFFKAVRSEEGEAFRH